MGNMTLYGKPPTHEMMAENMSVTERNISEQMTLFEPKEIVRPDLNIAKWSGFLFSSPWSKDLYDEKKFTFTLSGEVNASITIIPAVNKKRPTTTTQKVLYALIQIWEESGRPANGRIFFSARQLAHMLDWKWAGQDTALRIQDQLSILNSTTIDWERSFYSGDFLETQKEEMSLIDAKSYLARKKMVKQEFFYGQHNVRLNQDLVDNMIRGKTKPFNYHVFISIKNDGAIKLYNLLDNFLSNKRHWERRSYALVTEDLELSGKRYEELRIRHSKLKELKKALDGKELSSGKLTLSIAKTADGKDYKLIAEKSPKKVKKRIPPKLASPEVEIPFIVDSLIESLEKMGSFDIEKSKGILGVLARWYSRDMLFYAVSLVKVDFHGNIKTTPVRAFMYQVHVVAHERGMEWVKECSKSCRYRPENRTSIEEIASQLPLKEVSVAEKLEKKTKAAESALKAQEEVRRQVEVERIEAEEQVRKEVVEDFLGKCDKEKMSELMVEFETSEIFAKNIVTSPFLYEHYKSVGIKDTTIKNMFRRFLGEKYC